MRHVSGNSFDGHIREFEGVRIDNFANDGRSVRLYLLSHSHSDHLKGLDAKTFRPGGQILCSKLTFELLKFNRVAHQNLIFFKPVDENLPVKIKVGDHEIKITLIPSYHCPGSVMFLLDSGSKSVLCTGDIRAEDWWVQSLTRNPFLAPFISGGRTLDNIYLDTTFGYRGEPFIDIPSNNSGIGDLAKVLRHYPLEDPDVLICLRASPTGIEELWYHILEMFQSKIYLKPETLKLYDKCSKYGYSEYSKFLSNVLEPGRGKFNLCSSSHLECLFPISVIPVINIDKATLEAKNSPLLLQGIEERTSVIEVAVTSAGNNICEFNDRNWILYEDRLYPQKLGVYFSRHSSYEECCKLISLFRPREVYPCVESELSWAQGLQMSRIFGAQCEGDTFIYDKEKEVVYGSPIVHRQEPVQTADKSERLEKPIVLNMRKQLHFDFKGQHQVSAFTKKLNEEDCKYISKCSSLARINKLYIGRSAKRCVEIIKEEGTMKRRRNLSSNKKTKEEMTSSSSQGSSIIESDKTEGREFCINGNDHYKRVSFSDILPTIKNKAEDPEVAVLHEPLDYSTLDLVKTIDDRVKDYLLHDVGIGWFNINGTIHSG